MSADIAALRMDLAAALLRARTGDHVLDAGVLEEAVSRTLRALAGEPPQPIAGHIYAARNHITEAVTDASRRPEWREAVRALLDALDRLEAAQVIVAAERVSPGDPDPRD